MTGIHLTVTGWGPIRVPGERNRWSRAEQRARTLLTAAEAASEQQAQLISEEEQPRTNKLYVVSETTG
jgi:hypothetical protein